MDRDEIIARLRAFFTEQAEDVAAAYLYGSVARGTAREGSDVDVGVLMKEEPPRTIEGLGLDLQEELQLALGLPIEVVVLNRAPVDLVHRVLRDSVLLAQRDPSRRIAFEVKRRNEYFDLLPTLRLYRGEKPTAS